MFYVLIAICIYLLWKLKSSKNESSEPPELSGKLPLIGHGHHLLGSCEDMYNTMTKIFQETTDKGGVVKMYFGTHMVYVVTDPEWSLNITNTCLQKHEIYEVMKTLFANGLITADVPTWKTHRKLLNPAFNQQILDGFIETFNVQAQSLVDLFATKVDIPFSHDFILRKINLDTTCLTVVGVDPEEHSDLEKRYLERVEDLLYIFNKRFTKFWLHNDFIYSMSSLKKQEDEIMKYLLELSSSILQKKRNKMKEPVDKQKSPKKLKPFMDLLLEVAQFTNSLTDEQVREETMAIIVGGHETSASALTFALTQLGSSNEIQDKAYEEVLQVLGKTGTNVDKEALSKLKYIEAILKETLRFYPSSPVVGRQLDRDIKFKNYTLKANTGCFISIHGINRHKIWGPDVDTFRPERWLEKETLPDSKYHAAFGLGRRTCIGKAYAMMWMKVLLAKVLQKYRISSDISKMTIKMETLVKPASGFNITLHERNVNKRNYN